MKILPITTIFIVYVISLGYSANILAVFPHQGLSHHMVYLPYLQELANRGYNVTVISNYPSEHSKITDISIRGFVPIDNNKVNISDQFKKPINNLHASINVMKSFFTRGDAYKAMFTVNKVKKLLNSYSNYDLLLTEHFNHELSLVFALKFNIPFILMTSCNLLPWNEQVAGQPYELATKPVTLNYLPSKMNLYQRIVNTISHAIQLLGFIYFCRKRDEKNIKQKLKIDVSLDHLILNASLIFTNTHFTMFEPRSLVPAIVEVGGIHIKPIQPLHMDLQQFIDEAEHGVIYFCMGSLLRGETFPVEKRQMFLNVFSKIPQRILWKWEGDELPGKPPNVMIRKWMPQRDILAHPNVKLFISHGGLLGTTEAVHEGVPILSMPMFGDQMTNVKAVQDKGAAEILDFSDLNEDDIFVKVKTMLTNPIYKQKAKELSEAFRDRPMSPLDTAVYWTEYVIRHKGAPHLRSAAAGMPWYQYYLIDVILVIFLGLSSVCVLLYYLVFKIFLRLIKKQTKEKQT